MISFIAKRIFDAFLMLLLLASLTFIALYFLGSGVDSLIPVDVSDAVRQELLQNFGLTGGFFTQYGHFLKGLMQGHLGLSFVHHNNPFSLIVQRLPASLELAGLAVVFAFFIGFVWGGFAAYKPFSWLSKSLRSLALLGTAIPSYALGLLLIAFFALHLHLLPSLGRGETVSILGIDISFLTRDGLYHLALPLLTLVILKASLFARVAFAAFEETRIQDHLRYAQARGLSSMLILRRYFFKNMLLPMLSVAGLEFGSLIAFLMITESLFAWPGVGRLFVEAVHYLDRPMIIAYVLFVGFVYSIIHLVLDICAQIIDPRIKNP